MYRKTVLIRTILTVPRSLGMVENWWSYTMPELGTGTGSGGLRSQAQPEFRNPGRCRGTCRPFRDGDGNFAKTENYGTYLVSSESPKLALFSKVENAENGKELMEIRRVEVSPCLCARGKLDFYGGTLASFALEVS
jgi:hypothetical protein